jgi:hypothetical protein
MVFERYSRDLVGLDVSCGKKIAPHGSPQMLKIAPKRTFSASARYWRRT